MKNSMVVYKYQMGSYITKLLDSFSNMKAKILMLGLDNAGKTTILYQMKLRENTYTVPTIGFNVEEINYKGLKFTVWDIGGQTKLIKLWHHYYENSNAVIYVLDASDEDRIQLARETLHSVISNQSLKNAPLLVLANKMDIANLTSSQLVQRLGLHQTRKIWNLQPCCGLSGEGVIQGFEWLRKQLGKLSK